MGWFVRACFTEEGFELQPADAWTDDLWFLDQDHRILEPNEGWWSIGAGRGAGRLIGGNLCTLNLLQGTPYWPSLDGAILAVEDDELTDPAIFARDLTSLLQQPDAAGIRGLIVGRFQRVSGLTRALLEQIVARQPRLAALPVVGNVDFGHTSPLATLPIGGRVELTVADSAQLRIVEH